MSRWDNTSLAPVEYTVTGSCPYYREVLPLDLSKPVGTLKNGVKVTLQYQKDSDVMLIKNCTSDVLAVGKYIISSNDLSQNKVVTANKVITPTTEAKTTTDKTTGTTTPENTDADGNTSGSDVDVGNDTLYSDNTFITIDYSDYLSQEEYLNNLSDGLRVQDIRAILGMPHQFTALTDPRIDANDGVGDEDAFGRVYTEKIIKQIPLLLITPGSPTFLGNFSESQQKTLKEKIGNILSGNSGDDLATAIGGGKTGKYYSLKYNYTEYFHYVNAMLRSAAYFLGIQNKKVDSKRLGELDWLWTTSTPGSEIFGHGKLANFLGPYAGCLAMYVDAGNTVDESFSNSTTESSLASGLNSVSDQGREMNFLVGNVGSEVGLSVTKFTGEEGLAQNLQNIQDFTSKWGKVGGVLNSITGKITTLLAGGRLVFPEIWSDSSFSRSYQCSMKLISPAGDPFSIYMNILVPIYHILALTLPRQSIEQSYFSPFLVRAYYKGLFNIDMGIITGLSLTKGAEGEWTTSGLPTVANLSFEIKDLYDNLFMSPQSSDKGYQSIMSNIQELDYIANTCGVNINDQEVSRTIKMYISLGFSNIKDKITIDLFGGVQQYFNQKLNDIFGRFK